MPFIEVKLHNARNVHAKKKLMEKLTGAYLEGLGRPARTVNVLIQEGIRKSGTLAVNIV